MLPQPASPIRFRRLLLTGANGNLGRELRLRLKTYCDTLRLSHRSDMGPADDGVKRILFASSNHVTGFYRQDEVISPRDPVRPDGLYGLSKAFGENLAQLYWDRYGIETVSLRIGSSFTEPKDRRMLAT